ncbi:hypothetical protein TIFTF001_025083 [Ficus carica]|uniref:Uncharacterized protein n=1 Tax=Ficus carica TaxID=3494 RepID=A0AA88AYH4_FICCA|nr:hypothetical protein TIFTF001_025083 [Ficus carica]
MASGECRVFSARSLRWRGSEGAPAQATAARLRESRRWVGRLEGLGGRVEDEWEKLGDLLDLVRRLFAVQSSVDGTPATIRGAGRSHSHRSEETSRAFVSTIFISELVSAKMRGRSYGYSPSPPRGYSSRRRRSPSPRARYGSRGTSLLVRNLRNDCSIPPTNSQRARCPLWQMSPYSSLLATTIGRLLGRVRPNDLRGPFGQFGPLKDIYLPRDYHTGGRSYDHRRSPIQYSRSPRYTQTYSRSPDYSSPSLRQRRYSEYSQFLLGTGETGRDLIQGHLIIQGAKAEALAGVAVAVAVRASITPIDCPIQDLCFGVTI